MPRASSVRFGRVADDILAKAAMLFDRQGFSNTPLQEVADAVGIARPSLYHYFASKEELLAALVERSTGARDEITARVRGSQAPARQRLTDLLRGIGLATAEHGADFRLLLNNITALPADVRRRSTRSRRALFELVVELLAEGVNSGEFRPLDEREIAATMIAALTGLQYTRIGGVDMAPDRATDLLIEVLLQGIEQPGGRTTNTLEGVIDLLHRDLDALERVATRGRGAGRRKGQMG